MSCTPTTVLALGNRLKMSRVHACPVPAQVIQYQVRWHQTDESLIKESMGQSSPIDPLAQLAIRGVTEHSPQPSPATRFGDEIVGQGIGGSLKLPGYGAGSQPALIMLTTHAPDEGVVPSIAFDVVDHTAGHVPDDTEEGR